MLYNCDCLKGIKTLNDNSVDLVATDPPYGIGFMGKDWDKALPDKEIWAECLRVLKPGAFAFVMSIPRSDCLSRMIISLEDAGFRVDFSPIYWVYASGFPKAKNIGKAVDKRMGAERERTHPDNEKRFKEYKEQDGNERKTFGELDTMPLTPQAKALDGSYGGFQPKPAVEVIIVCMKPLSEKTFVDQSLKNRKGITWLDDCRIPYGGETPNMGGRKNAKMGGDQPYGFKIEGRPDTPNTVGRFPANLLVSDDVLNDGGVTRSGFMKGKHIAPNSYGGFNTPTETQTYPDSGSFSRYFDLDKWWEERVKELPKPAQQTFPFLIVPKASKSEKNRGLKGGSGSNTYNRKCLNCGKWERKQGLSDNYTCYCEKPDWEQPSGNNHPTVKPIKLMSYLITLGSREGDIILDPFLGSGTTAIACEIVGRDCIGYEIDKGYFDIAIKRVEAFKSARN